MRKFPFIIIYLVFSLIYVNAQPSDNSKILQQFFGLRASFNLYDNSADLRQIKTVPDSAATFASGSTNGFSAGFLYEIPVSQRLAVELSLMYQQQNAMIAGDVAAYEPADLALGADQVHHIIKSDFSLLQLEPLVKFKLIGNFLVMGGFTIGGRLAKKIDYTKTVQKTEGNNSPQVLAIQNISFAGQESSFGLGSALKIGIGYEFPNKILDNYHLEADLFFNSGFVHALPDFIWDANTLSFSVAIKYDLSHTAIKPVEHFKTGEHTDTIIVRNENLNEKSITNGLPKIITDTIVTNNERYINIEIFRTDTIFEPAARVLFNNPAPDILKIIRVKPPKLFVEEYLSSNMQPLLNFIFFEKNTDTIPKRYKRLTNQETKNIDIKKLFSSDAMGIYYNVLNIVGYRMNMDYESKLTITGYNSNTGDEKNNLSLSRKRAESVADYLTQTWGIGKSRLKVIARNLPDNPSLGNDSASLEENNRVELKSDNPEILAPIISVDTMRVASQQYFSIPFQANFPHTRSDYKIFVLTDDQIIKEYESDGLLNSSVVDLNDLLLIYHDFRNPLECYAEIKSDSGNNVRSDTILIRFNGVKVNQDKLEKLGDKKIDTYSLILFGFDKNFLNNENMRIIDFINKNISSNSSVKVEGYTDNLGDEEYNIQLSGQRAKNVAKMLNSKNVEFKGLGESKTLFDNSLPEGRFYCRTVKIIVETPIE